MMTGQKIGSCDECGCTVRGKGLKANLNKDDGIQLFCDKECQYKYMGKELKSEHSFIQDNDGDPWWTSEQ